MAFKPVVLGSVSALALVTSAPVLAQTPPKTGGVPTDAPETPSDGTPARSVGPAVPPPAPNTSDAAASDAAAPTTAAAPGQAPASGDEIVVTGVRASIVGALNVKRNATQVVDSIVAEDVGKLPDNNVIEALQRVTGVQVTDRGAGEAGAISIRGLPDALTTLNGRNIFTASGQAFALQDIPATLVKRVDVYKTRAAEQIETGIAGQIDVFTRRPFDFKGFAISAVARGIYDEQSRRINPIVSGLISDRWETGIGDIGVLVNASYTRYNYRTQAVTAGAQVPFADGNPTPGTGLTPYQRIFPAATDPITGAYIRGPGAGEWQPGTDAGLPDAAGSTMLVNGVATPYLLSRDAVFSSDLYGRRERPSVNAALQWSPNSRSVYTAEMFYSGFRGNTFNSLQFSFVDFWLPQPTNVQLYDGTNIVQARNAFNVFGFQSGDYATNKTDDFVYALNGKWDVGQNGKITADLSRQNSKNETTFFAQRLNRVASEIDVNFNTGNGIPSYHFADDRLLAQPTSWNVGELYDNGDINKGGAYTLHLDGEYKWDSGFLRQIKAGVRYDNRTARALSRAADAGALGVNLSTLGPDAYYLNHNFFDGEADVPTFWIAPNGYYNAANADAVRQLYLSTLGTTNNIRLSSDFNFIPVFRVREVNKAAYVQADVEVPLFGRPLQAQAGVRYVDVKTNVNFTDRFTGIATPGSANAHRLLPSVTVRYEPIRNVRLRFNYGETLRRPGFGDLNPNYTLTGDLTQVGRGSGSRGNPTLQPTRSKNLDLSAEWYFDRDSAIYGTLFKRNIQGLVVPITSLQVIPGTGLNTNNFVITQPENASNGVLKGGEFGFVFFPRWLPGVFKGLGAQGSFTLLRSSQNIPEVDINGNITGQSRTSFFGVSNFSYNVTAAYDRGPIGARLSYVWRQAFLQRNEARLFANPIGVWRRPDKSLDFQLTYNLSKQLGLTLDATNLTKAKQQEYYKFGDKGGFEMYNLGTVLIPRTFALGVRYAFD
ncbi:TonB-dependent receptor [Sphingomonas ginkgonis]|uniref:TonB-dependent receptor n=1 Tax=Sphingomonas ginkgonis TaxID=2315330 RepID=A0A3R9YJM3_9SPHN|nr:TonB-dependent receptor [Sphingomonas ginkgonis]RST31426.1 TonB-dependent receptor [Sphingomonas ginkgonis]